MKTYPPDKRRHLLGLLATAVVGVSLLVWVAHKEVAAEEARRLALPPILSPEEIREETDPLMRMRSADVLVRYRQGAPLRLIFPQDPQDTGRNVELGQLVKVLATHPGGRDYAVVLVFSDDSNFIANDFAADRVGRELRKAGFTRIEVIKYQDDPPEDAPSPDPAP